MKTIKDDGMGERVTLTQVNADNVRKIAERLGTTPDDIVNRILYILMSETSGIREDIEYFCISSINAKKRTAEEILLQYKAKHLQQIENYTALQSIMGCLDDEEEEY